MKVEEPARWACTIPPRPSITPSEFWALVQERATASAAPSDTRAESIHDAPEVEFGIQLKHTVPQYLDAFRTLRVKPRPCKHWLGSPWQRQLADLVIEQKKKPEDTKAQQGNDEASKPAAAPARSECKATGASSVGMSEAFMNQLKTRRRDELKKAQDKAAEERREQERVAHMNAKVLEVKRAKLDTLNRMRAADCTAARQQLASKVEAAKEVTVKLEQVKKELQAVEVDKHNAVTQLKAQRAVQNLNPNLTRSAHPPSGTDATTLSSGPASNGTALPKLAGVGVGERQAAAADAAGKPEGQAGDFAALPGPRSEVVEGEIVLPLGVRVHAPPSPTAAALIVPRLFASHDDIDLSIPEGDTAEFPAKAGAQKRKREDDKVDVHSGQKKVPVAGAAFLPPPQPLASNSLGAKCTLPPAPNTNSASSNQLRKLQRSDPPAAWPAMRSPGGRFADEPRQRHPASDVFGGVRGSSGPDRRPETGSFISRPAAPAHGPAAAFLPRVQPEEGDDLLSGQPGFPGKTGGTIADGLKPLPPIVRSEAAVRASFGDRQTQLLPPPPIHSMAHSDDVPPPPAWNLGPKVRKDVKGGD